MRYILGIIVVITASANSARATDHIDSVFKIGVNWMTGLPISGRLPTVAV